jgi:hypothetical protein
LAWFTDSRGARLVICLFACFLAIFLSFALSLIAKANVPPPTAMIKAIAEITSAGEGSRRILVNMKVLPSVMSPDRGVSPLPADPIRVLMWCQRTGTLRLSESPGR